MSRQSNPVELAADFLIQRRGVVLGEYFPDLFPDAMLEGVLAIGYPGVMPPAVQQR